MHRNMTDFGKNEISNSFDNNNDPSNQTSVQFNETTVRNENSNISDALENNSGDATIPNEKCINERASSIVENVIDSASLSFISSGDYSLLNDEIKNKDTKPIKTEENLNQKDESFEILEPENTEKLDVLGNGLLTKEILCKGNGVKAERGQEVVLDVNTRLKSGEIIEDNREMTFIVADQDVVPALDLCVNLMEQNERSEIISDAKYCYGETGKEPNIPPNSPLIYNVLLKEINEGPYNTSVPIRKRLDWVDKKRTAGNQLYMDKKFHEAVQVYMKCTKVLQQAQNQDQTKEIEEEIASFSVKCHNNLAASHMKTEDWKEALKCCGVAERLDQHNVKTLFRKAKILIQLNELSRAVNILKKVKELKPEDKAIQAEYVKQTKCLTQQKEKQKKMYQKMIGVKSVKESPKEDKPTNNSIWASIFSPKSIGCSLIVVTGAILLGIYSSHR